MLLPKIINNCKIYMYKSKHDIVVIFLKFSIVFNTIQLNVRIFVFKKFSNKFIVHIFFKTHPDIFSLSTHFVLCRKNNSTRGIISKFYFLAFFGVSKLKYYLQKSQAGFAAGFLDKNNYSILTNRILWYICMCKYGNVTRPSRNMILFAQNSCIKSFQLTLTLCSFGFKLHNSILTANTSTSLVLSQTYFIIVSFVLWLCFVSQSNKVGEIKFLRVL